MSDGMSDGVVRERKKRELQIDKSLSLTIEEQTDGFWSTTFHVIQPCPWFGWHTSSESALVRQIKSDIVHAKWVRKFLERNETE